MTMVTHTSGRTDLRGRRAYAGSAPSKSAPECISAVFDKSLAEDGMYTSPGLAVMFQLVGDVCFVELNVYEIYELRGIYNMTVEKRR